MEARGASIAEISELIAEWFPGERIKVEALGSREATVRFFVDDSCLRPGGTVSGPVMMTLADTALYAAILGELGLVALAVTTNLNINFLRRPEADRDLLGVCQLIKVGRALVVGEVAIYSEGKQDPVAHAVGTYSLPPNG